jgi:hypothetical protein
MSSCCGCSESPGKKDDTDRPPCHPRNDAKLDQLHSERRKARIRYETKIPRVQGKLEDLFRKMGNQSGEKLGAEAELFTELRHDRNAIHYAEPLPTLDSLVDFRFHLPCIFVPRALFLLLIAPLAMSPIWQEASSFPGRSLPCWRIVLCNH